MYLILNYYLDKLPLVPLHIANVCEKFYKNKHQQVVSRYKLSHGLHLDFEGLIPQTIFFWQESRVAKSTDNQLLPTKNPSFIPAWPRKVLFSAPPPPRA